MSPYTWPMRWCARTRRTAAWLAVAGWGLAGCSPVSVTFTFGENGASLSESVVAQDDGAGDAKVALIDIRGLIADARRPGLTGPGPSPTDELAARLDRASKDDAVRAVVLRINSPGGTVTGSDVMYGEIRRFRETSGKPVVASLGEVAASGGYYVALAADRIVAHPTTITGSIGVIIPTVNVSDGLRRLGVVSRAITSGPNKDLGNPLEPARESHYVLLQSLVDDFYARFRGLVVERRGSGSSGEGQRALAMDRIDELTDGRVLSGAAAERSGLVDATGDVRAAFAMAKRLCGQPAASLVKYHSGGAAARSPYAAAPGEPLASGDDGRGSGATLHLDLAALVSGPVPAGNAYYLWLPDSP